MQAKASHECTTPSGQVTCVLTAISGFRMRCNLICISQACAGNSYKIVTEQSQSIACNFTQKRCRVCMIYGATTAVSAEETSLQANTWALHSTLHVCQEGWPKTRQGNQPAELKRNSCSQSLLSSACISARRVAVSATFDKWVTK
jgi:hypothetical protein